MYSATTCQPPLLHSQHPSIGIRYSIYLIYKIYSLILQVIFLEFFSKVFLESLNHKAFCRQASLKILSLLRNSKSSQNHPKALVRVKAKIILPCLSFAHSLKPRSCSLGIEGFTIGNYPSWFDFYVFFILQGLETRTRWREMWSYLTQQPSPGMSVSLG